MQYCRINLSKTNYAELDNYQLIPQPNRLLLDQIYREYCQYKKFNSVMPMFDNDYYGVNSEVLGYYNNSQELVAFSLIRRQDCHSVEAVQFAWNYHEPRLRLGIRSLESECARYKRLGYRYLYLGFADEYKQQFAGFELLGPAI